MSATIKSDAPGNVAFATSGDGTRIAFEKFGKGPALVVVGGALSDRSGGKPLADALKDHFTVYAYDRRGRGDSGDTKPYAVDRSSSSRAATPTSMASRRAQRWPYEAPKSSEARRCGS